MLSFFNKLSFDETNEEERFNSQAKKELELWDKRFQEYLYNEYYFIEFLEKVNNNDASKYFVIICDIDANDIDELNVNCLKNARTFWYNIQLTKNKLCESVFNFVNYQSFNFNIVLIVHNKEIVKWEYINNGELIALNRNESFIYCLPQSVY